MKGGTNIKQKAIVLMPFPYSDLSQKKKRPALVVSSNEFNRGNDDIVCCLITSNLKDKSYSVLIDNGDLTSGYLEFKSKVKAFKLFTVSKELVYMVLGELKPKKFNEVVENIYETIPKAKIQSV